MGTTIIHHLRLLFPRESLQNGNESWGAITESREVLVDTFNTHLFRALNIVGVALLLVLIGYRIFMVSPGSKIPKTPLSEKEEKFRNALGIRFKVQEKKT